jgi:5-formyltetrahydrofolate cyclo-ligase
MRAAIPPAKRRVWEAALGRRLLAELTNRLEAAAKVGQESPGLVYLPFGTEPDLMPVVEALWRLGAPLAAPRTVRNSRRLIWKLIRRYEDLQPGVWGIREPKPECPDLSAEDMARAPFILVPGVAFDARGGRLGYGGGYYDRFLSGFLGMPQRPLLLAAAFEQQLVDEVPTEEHDIPVSVLMTERRRIGCRSVLNAERME